MSSELPPANPSQPYIHVSVLEGGHMNLPEHLVVKGGSPTTYNVIPCMAFVLRHSQSGKRILFDLGLRKDWEENGPPAVVKLAKMMANPDVPVDVVESLHRGGVEPHEIDIVILSHVHFDHVGDPTLFPSAQFIAHEGAKPLLAGGYSPEDTEPATHPNYAKNLLAESHTSYVSGDEWSPVGPFPRGFDFFGDGSLYLIDAAGHLPGHINVLARTSEDGSWILLAGDSAHDVRIITGEKEIAIYSYPGGCMHEDLASAKAHIEMIKQVKALRSVQVLLSHDYGWFNENRDRGVIFPGEIRALSNSVGN